MRILFSTNDLASIPLENKQKNYVIKSQDNKYSIVALNIFEKLVNQILKIFGSNYFKLRKIELISTPTGTPKKVNDLYGKESSRIDESKLCYYGLLVSSPKPISEIKKNAERIKTYLNDTDAQKKYFNSQYSEGVSVALQNEMQRMGAPISYNEIQAGLRYLVLHEEIAGFSFSDRGQDFIAYKHSKDFPQDTSKLIFTKEGLSAAYEYMASLPEIKISEFEPNDHHNAKDILYSILLLHWNKAVKDPYENYQVSRNHYSVVSKILDKFVEKGLIHSWSFTDRMYYPVVKLSKEDVVDEGLPDHWRSKKEILK